MAILLKVTLLFIYLALLFILARLLEVVAWYEQGQISRRLLDPMTLSVLRLKALIEQRGMSYDSILEKTELAQLVDATGAVTDEEIDASTGLNGDMQITNYTSDIDFYEQVEDAKDSMWLVEIVTDNGGILSNAGWHLLRNKVAKFGVRLGRFNCQQQARLCMKKSWFTSRLVLALPENYHTKANVALYTYQGPVRINSLFDWITSKVNEQIKVIEDVDELEEEWLNFDSSLNADVRVVFVSTLTSVPLFLSALTVRFPGRVKIGSVKMNTAKGNVLATKLDVKSSPAYIIITRDIKYIYGNSNGEVRTFGAMEMFLKSVYPSVNDIFIVSFICTNIVSFFELCIVGGGIMKRFIKFMLCVFKYNLILLLVWITVLALLQISVCASASFTILKCLRYCTLTSMFSYVRKDFLYYSSHKIRLLSVLMFLSAIVTFIKIKYFSHTEEIELEEEADWWNFSNLRTLNYHNGWEMMRLRPFDQIFNPSFAGPSSIMYDGEHCQTINSTEYINLLPVWVFKNYKCTCECNTGYDVICDNIENTNKKHEQSGLQEMASTVFSSGHAGDTCSCGRQRNLDLGDNPNCIPSPNSCDHLEGPSLGTIFDSPWDGVTKLNSKLKKFENCKRYERKPFGYMEGTQCVICLEDFACYTLLRGLPCWHVFHDKCILAWLLREHHFCPVCRWPSFKSKDKDCVNDLHSE